MHLIAAWELSEVEGFLRDRLFCRRTGLHVPYSLEEHPPSIQNDLSIRVREGRRERDSQGAGTAVAVDLGMYVLL